MRRFGRTVILRNLSRVLVPNDVGLRSHDPRAPIPIGIGGCVHAALSASHLVDLYPLPLTEGQYYFPNHMWESLCRPFCPSHKLMVKWHPQNDLDPNKRPTMNDCHEPASPAPSCHKNPRTQKRTHTNPTLANLCFPFQRILLRLETMTSRNTLTMMNSVSSYRHTSTVSRHGRLCSAHVLINHERQLRRLPLYHRSRTLDAAARKEAELIASRIRASDDKNEDDQQSLDHEESSLFFGVPHQRRQASKSQTSNSVLSLLKSSSSFFRPRQRRRQRLQQSLHHPFDGTCSMTDHQMKQYLEQQGSIGGRQKTCRIGETVLCGEQGSTVRHLHYRAMHISLRRLHIGPLQKQNLQCRQHILSTAYTHVGIGTAMAPDGSLLMVQFFRGSPSSSGSSSQPSSSLSITSHQSTRIGRRASTNSTY